MPILSFDIGRDFDRVLTKIAMDKGVSKAEIIRRAVASYVYLNKQVKQGCKISITTQYDRVVKDVVLP